MTYRTMLDTNILSDVVRRPCGLAAAGMARHGEDGLCTSIVCAAELRLWAAKSDAPRLGGRIDAMLANLHVLPFEAPADRLYAKLRATLEAGRDSIGPNDLLIAAHALALGLTLVTHDAHFARVPGLATQDWLA